MTKWRNETPTGGYMCHRPPCFATQHITQAKRCIVYYVSLLYWTGDRIMVGGDQEWMGFGFSALVWRVWFNRLAVWGRFGSVGSVWVGLARGGSVMVLYHGPGCKLFSMYAWGVQARATRQMATQWSQWGWMDGRMDGSQGLME